VAVLFVYIALMMVCILWIAKRIARKKISAIMPPPTKPVEMKNLAPGPTYHPIHNEEPNHFHHPKPASPLFINQG